MRTFLTMTALAVAMAANAGAAEKRAADWTLEERLAKRFDAADVAERDRAYRAAHPQIANDEGATVKHLEPGERMTAYVIDGSRNPELLLPHELFAQVVTAVTIEEPVRSKQKQFYRAGVRHFFGDDEVFWAAIAELSSRHGAANPPAGERCRAVHHAFEAAQAKFGAARFNDFLYDVIAPTMFYAGVSTTRDPIGELREAEWGCAR
jgi:hypothetical protein